jgi:hypothetical protein
MYGGIDLHFNNSVVAVILKRSSAPMIWPPQMTTRDLVLMAGQSQSTTDRGRCCPTRIRSSADRRAGSWASWRLTRPSERSSRDWPASLGAPMLNASLRKRQQLAKRNFHGGSGRGAPKNRRFSAQLCSTREPVQQAIGSGYLCAPLQYCRNMFCVRSRKREILDYL